MVQIQEGSQYATIYMADGLVALKRDSDPLKNKMYFSRKFYHTAVEPTSQVGPLPCIEVLSLSFERKR